MPILPPAQSVGGRSYAPLGLVDRRLFVASAVVMATFAALNAFASPSTGPDDMFLGSPDAPVVIHEYASPTCPPCRRWRTNVFPDVKARFIDVGKVRFVLKEMPSHNLALDAGVFALARCAGRTSYFDLLDAAYDRQDELLASSTRPSGPLQALLDLAAEFGLERRVSETCLRSPVATKRAAQALEDARANAVTGTPTLFINGRRVATPDAVDPGAFLRLVGEAVASAQDKRIPQPQSAE